MSSMSGFQTVVIGQTSFRRDTLGKAVTDYRHLQIGFHKKITIEELPFFNHQNRHEFDIYFISHKSCIGILLVPRQSPILLRGRNTEIVLYLLGAIDI